MGLRFSKSIKLGKGVNLNFSKSGIGMSVGTKGMRVGTGPRGTKATLGIPGTGISYTKTVGKNNKRYENEFKTREKTPLEIKIESFILKILVFILGVMTSFLSLVFLLMIFDKYSFLTLFGVLLFGFIGFKSFAFTFKKKNKLNEQNNTDDLETFEDLEN